MSGSKMTVNIEMLSNPYSDRSDPYLWDEEVLILERIERGVDLVMQRHYIEAIDNYAVSWYWQDKDYPAQCDTPVIRLLGRQVIRPTQVAGGYAKMELTEQYKNAQPEESTEQILSDIRKASGDGWANVADIDEELRGMR